MQEITIHEKVYASIAILGFLVAGAFGFYALTHQESTTSTVQVGGTGFALQCFDSTQFVSTTTPGYDMSCGGAATTTQDYLFTQSGTATTTLETVNISQASSADVNLYTQYASSSTAVIQLTFWVSYNNIDWYPLSTSTAPMTPMTYPYVNWSLTGNASTTNIHLSNLNENYLQIRAHAVTASSTFYSQVIPLKTITQ